MFSCSECNDEGVGAQHMHLILLFHGTCVSHSVWAPLIIHFIVTFEELVSSVGSAISFEDWSIGMISWWHLHLIKEFSQFHSRVCQLSRTVIRESILPSDSLV